MARRGEVIQAPTFHTRDRAKQLIDFTGMRFNKKVRPTDIDGFNGEKVSAALDFDDGRRGFVFYEVKYRDNTMDIGQRRHLEALSNNLKSINLVLCVSHTVDNPEEDVMLKDCIVTEAYFLGDWVDHFNGRTALDVTTGFVTKYCPEYLLG